jgi:hypothetical protein
MEALALFEKRKAAKQAAAKAAVRQELEWMLRSALGEADADTPVILKPGEHATYVIRGAGLFEPRRGPGHWTGGSSGFSVPVGGSRTRFRVGATRGHYVQGAEAPTIIDTGTVTFTDRRVIFTGGKYTREWSFAKLVGIQHFSKQPWTAIHVSNREKTSGFTYKGLRPEFIHARLELAVGLYQGERDEIVRQLRDQLAELSPSDEGADQVPTSSGKEPEKVPEPVGAPTSDLPPPAWAPDPTGQHRLRWWDGRQWTDHTSD